MQPGQRGRLEPQGGAWARGSLCPHVCAWASPRAVLGEPAAVLGDAALVRPWSPSPRSFREPGTLPSPPPCLASAQRPGPAPGFLESPAGRWGPWGLPARPIASRSRARRGRRGGRSREDAAATSADEPDHHPRPHPAGSSAPPQPPAGRRVPPASPLWPRLSLGRLCLFPPSTLRPSPSLCPLSHPGVQGRAVEVRGRTEVGVGWALGVSWCQASSWSEGCQEIPSAGSRAGSSQDLWVCRGWRRRV